MFGTIAYTSRQSTQLPKVLSTDNVLSMPLDKAIAHDELPISPRRRGVSYINMAALFNTRASHNLKEQVCKDMKDKAKTSSTHQLSQALWYYLRSLNVRRPKGKTDEQVKKSTTELL